MKTICDFCKNQGMNRNEFVQCSLAAYESDAYGEHKRGCICIHDSQLRDGFEPRSKEDVSVKKMISIIKSQSNKLIEQRERIARLEQRLLDV